MTKLIGKLVNTPVFREEGHEPELAKFEIKECFHENRGVRLPPVIRTVADWYDDAYWEYCKDCGEITRTNA